MAAIICTGDDDEKSYCNACDALLYVRKDGSRVCSNGNCGITYEADKITHHRTGLHPMEEESSPEIVPLTEYYGKTKKKQTLGDIEDRHLVSKKSGMSITSYYDSAEERKS